MSIETIVIYALIGLNLVQLVFWAICVHKLIDKIMSRNYAEYVQSKPVRPVAKSSNEVDSNQAEEEEVLRELNGMLSH